MARKTPPSKSIIRKSAHKSPRFKIIAVCEGKNTEKAYLNSFARHHGNGLVEVLIVAPAGVPLSVVEKAVEERTKLNQVAKKSKNRFAKLFQVWAVFDIDEHPNIYQAIDLAKGNMIKTAISNPCIEIWPLLHFVSHSSFIHRHDLQSELAKHMPSYKPNGSKLIEYDQIKDKFEIARDRAIKQLEDHQATDTKSPFDNPSTTFYLLLDKIIDNGIK